MKTSPGNRATTIESRDMTEEIRKIAIEQLRKEIAAQGVPQEHVAVVCPACGFVQSEVDFVKAGVPRGDVPTVLGFSCVGRYSDAKPPRKKPDGKPCNWTLGGLFQIHRLQVTDEKGTTFPLFELASPRQARLHAVENGWRTLSDEQEQILRHTLGADSRYKKSQWGFRNHFCAGMHSPQHEILRNLEASGYMVSGRVDGNNVFYHATELACKALGFSAKRIKELKEDRTLPREDRNDTGRI